MCYTQSMKKILYMAMTVNGIIAKNDDDEILNTIYKDKVTIIRSRSELSLKLFMEIVSKQYR